MLSDELIHSLYQQNPNESHLDFARKVEASTLMAVASALFEVAQDLLKENNIQLSLDFGDDNGEA